MEPLSIRPATRDDVSLILRFIRALGEYEHLAHEVVATEDGLRESLFGKTPQAEVAIASMGPHPVGFALFFHNYSTFLGRRGLYLEDLFVLPEHRGHGVGRALLSWLAKTALERGCGRFEWSVLDWNAPAIRFYENLGARPMSDWTTFRITGEAMRGLAAETDVRQ
jgi:GNAT superfamily N-acetyltransferase